MFIYEQLLSTFDINESVEESDGFEGEKVGQILHANFERVPVIQFQVGVNRETQVLLNLLTQLVQQVLQRLDCIRYEKTRFTNVQEKH